ncbi:serine palmitoyltransferase small subunit B [Drosophila gunungcola]|uniref:serine palmitoyltransferase small subunit B n=1 Tax=Drosophila gunungcola TaxID=103775 RepID=UPI0022E97754|nr:serine palmitoyltransferase small subunit B [Drosophila gunungcola]
MSKNSMFQNLAEDYAKFKRYVKWLYVLYELNTQIAICEPWEKVFLNVLLGSCVSLILYASFAFVPSYCVTVFHLLWPQTIVQNLTSPCSSNLEGFCGNESGAVIT